MRSIDAISFYETTSITPTTNSNEAATTDDP